MAPGPAQRRPAACAPRIGRDFWVRRAARPDQRPRGRESRVRLAIANEAGDATSIRPTEDDLFLINLSVWSSLEALRAFVYTSAHVHVLRQRRSWFEQLASAHMVLWWVPAGHIPTADEALERLERLRRDGPSPAAFTFRAPFEPEAAFPGSSVVDAEFCWPELAAS